MPHWTPSIVLRVSKRPPIISAQLWIFFLYKPTCTSIIAHHAQYVLNIISHLRRLKTLAWDDYVLHASKFPQPPLPLKNLFLFICGGLFESFIKNWILKLKALEFMFHEFLSIRSLKWVKKMFNVHAHHQPNFYAQFN